MLNKWGRKLQKELDKTYSKAEQEHLCWGCDVETNETYTWVFQLEPGSKNKQYWVLNKKTGKVAKK